MFMSVQSPIYGVDLTRAYSLSIDQIAAYQCVSAYHPRDRACRHFPMQDRRAAIESRVHLSCKFSKSGR